MKKFEINKMRIKISYLLRVILISLTSMSVALGQTFGNYLGISMNEPARAESTTVYVDAGSSGARNYADDLAARLAQRLSDQGLDGRISVQSGYGCDATVCLKVSYKVDGYVFGQEVKITESLSTGSSGWPSVSNPQTPNDPISVETPSQDAVKALNDAKRRYEQAKENIDRAAQAYAGAKRRLDSANQTLTSLLNDARSAENRLNSAIQEANRSKDAATAAGYRAAEAAQRASDRKTEFDRLKDYKPKLEAQRSALEDDLKKLEGEVGQAAASTNSLAEASISAGKSKANEVATSTRDRQKSGLSSHNNAAATLANSISLDKDLGDIKPDQPIAEASQFKTSANTIGGQKVRDSAAALNTAKLTLDTFSARQREPGDRILPVAQSTIYMADNAYARGDIDQGDFAIRATGALLEMAIGLAPLAILLAAPEALALMTAAVAGALALDFYQSWTGKHILTGEPLTEFEHGLSIFGVSMAIIPFGPSAKAGLQSITKALQLGEEFVLATKTGAESAELARAFEAVEEAAEQGIKIGAETLEASKSSFEFSGRSKIPIEEIKEVLGNTDVFKEMPRNAPEFGGFKQGIDGDQIREINRAFGGEMEIGGAIETGLANAANYTGFYSKSAAIVEKIVAGHLFDNGNKRTAVAVFEILQIRNGVFTPLSHDQVVGVIDNVAKGAIVGVENISKALQGL